MFGLSVLIPHVYRRIIGKVVVPYMLFSMKQKPLEEAQTLTSEEGRSFTYLCMNDYGYVFS